VKLARSAPAQPLLGEPPESLGPGRQVGLLAPPVVELLQKLGLKARADHLAGLLGPLFSCIRVNTSCFRHGYVLSRTRTGGKREPSPRL
jgi:hypothetical protein